MSDNSKLKSGLRLLRVQRIGKANNFRIARNIIPDERKCGIGYVNSIFRDGFMPDNSVTERNLQNRDLYCYEVDEMLCLADAQDMLVQPGGLYTHVADICALTSIQAAWEDGPLSIKSKFSSADRNLFVVGNAFGKPQLVSVETDEDDAYWSLIASYVDKVNVMSRALSTACSRLFALSPLKTHGS